MPARNRSNAALEALAGFRSRLRRFLRFTKEVSRRSGITPMRLPGTNDDARGGRSTTTRTS